MIKEAAKDKFYKKMIAKTAEIYAIRHTEDHTGFAVTYAEICETIEGTGPGNAEAPMTAAEQIAIFNYLGDPKNRGGGEST